MGERGGSRWGWRGGGVVRAQSEDFQIIKVLKPQAQTYEHGHHSMIKLIL